MNPEYLDSWDLWTLQKASLEGVFFLRWLQEPKVAAQVDVYEQTLNSLRNSGEIPTYDLEAQITLAILLKCVEIPALAEISKGLEWALEMADPEELQELASKLAEGSPQ